MRTKIILIVICFLLFLGGCKKETSINSDVSPVSSPIASPKLDKLTVNQVINAFQVANIPLPNLEIFNPETDPNKLLGRPHQYIEKAKWTGKEKQPSLEKHSIEIFNDLEDLEARKKYVESITKSISALAEYQFVYKNVLLRLHHNLTPNEAERYKNVLESL